MSTLAKLLLWVLPNMLKREAQWIRGYLCRNMEPFCFPQPGVAILSLLYVSGVRRGGISGSGSIVTVTSRRQTCL